MEPPPAIKLEVGRKPPASGARVLALMQINFFALHCPPQALREDAVQNVAFAVYVDLHGLLLQAPQILAAREMTALVAVADRRCPAEESTVHWRENERHPERLIEFPS